MVNFTGLRIQVLVAKVSDVFIISSFNTTAGYISFKNMDEKSKDLSITKFIKRLAQKWSDSHFDEDSDSKKKIIDSSPMRVLPCW